MMSPDDEIDFLTPLNSSAGSSVQYSVDPDLTIDRIRARANCSRSTSSKSSQPSWFAPVINSSPQKNSTTSRPRPLQHSRATLPLSPPLSLNGSDPSSSRSIEDDLTAEFSQIQSGLDVLKKATAKATKEIALECRDHRLIGECNQLVRKLGRAKKRTPPIFVDDSNFQIHCSSSDSSTERLASGGSRIENPRANLLSRGAEQDGIFSPPPPVSPLRLMKDEGDRRREGNERRTEGTQTDYERVRETVRDRDTRSGRRTENYYDEREMEEERRQRTKNKVRVHTVDDRSSNSSPERDRLPPRNERNTVEDRFQRREVHYEPAVTQSVDELRRDGEWNLSLPSVFSLPSRIRIEPFQLPARVPEVPRLEHRVIPERRKSPVKSKEMIGSRMIMEKSRMELMREEKEKKAMDWFPPVIDIDQLRGRKKCPVATKAMFCGEEVKKKIGEERTEVRRGRSVGVRIEKKRDPSVGKMVKKAAFVASSQVDGVSHSLGANRQQLLNLIKCYLPYIHLRVKEYLEGKATKEHNIISGLRNFLREEASRVKKDKENNESEYDRTIGSERKEEIRMEINRLDAILSELKYLIGELEILKYPSISSSIVNQLRCIHSHLLKCAPLRSEERSAI